MAVDASMRNLKFPPRFLPYLEKHRVYELFFELGNELAMARPTDHLTFLRESLTRLQRARDRALVVLMCPPHLDRVELAHLLASKTGYTMISRYLVCSKPGSRDYYNPDALARNTADLVKGSTGESCILVDFPDTEEEAKSLINSGVLPTHSILLEDGQGAGDDDMTTLDTTPSSLFEFNNSLHKLKELYRSSLKLINIKGRGLDEIAGLCAQLVVKMPFRPAPKLFRVALIGHRGCRRKTIARLLQERFKLVHVDMQQLISAAKIREDDLGDKIRNLDSNKCPLPVKIVMDLLKTRMYREDCLTRGYVLTNFPCSLADFVLLDSLDTPPNKVIFLSVERDDCRSKSEGLLVDVHTGGVHSKSAIGGDPLLKSQIFTHPDDDPCKVAEEIKFYKKRVQAMLDYCGKTCWVIDATGPISAVLEKVEAVLMGPSLGGRPRTGKMTRGDEESVKRENGSPQRLPHPGSQTVVAPFIDSEDLLKRFQALKGGLTTHKSVKFLPDN